MLENYFFVREDGKTPFEVLEISADSTPDEVKARWRQLAKIYHPDVKETGNQVMFMEVRDAYEVAFLIASEPKKCEPCSGTGKKQVFSGFSELSMTCGVCGGSGIG